MERLLGTPGASDPIEKDLLLQVLDDAVAALSDSDITFLVMGGIASAIFGRARVTSDIDLFVRQSDSDRVLEALAKRGFRTEVIYEHWLSKAALDGVTVDIISRSTPDILLDDEMVRRAVIGRFEGRRLWLVPPEDLVVMKALAASEDTPRYWYDALGIIGHADLDWDYLIRRARANGPRRVLALLLYAWSNDLVVPGDPVRTLFDLVTQNAPNPGGHRDPTGTSS
ncbi:MAG: nucleotidyltransferase family protein [Actinobacteria bacterium]|nr:MAG: nucleotidyltransferase family protein [Actinomycetota bacterium]